MDERPRYYNLETPAHLGREYPVDPDPYSDVPRHRAAGSIVFLLILLIVAAFAYASEGAWFIALFCGFLAVALAVGSFRYLKRALQDQVNEDPTETLKTLVHRRR